MTVPAAGTTTLFGHLALRFAESPENLATEALLFLLSVSPAARRGFAAAFRPAAVELPELRFVSQSTGKDGERPDLVGIDVAGSERVVVEAKFWAALTDNQPATYLGRLAVGGLLAFVAPEIRGDVLWRELRERCAAVGHTLRDPRAAEPGLWVGGASGGPELVLISWRRLLASVRAELEATGERDRVADLAQLDGLCERMDTEAFLPVTRSELSSPVYRRVLEFSDLVDAVIEQLVADRLLLQKGTRLTAGKGYYLRYCKTERGWSGSLRLDVNRWVQSGSFPIWYDPHHGSRGSDFVSRREIAWSIARPLEAQGCQLASGWMDFPAVAIDVPVGEEKPAVVAAVRKRLVQLMDLFAPLASGAPPEGEGA